MTELNDIDILDLPDAPDFISEIPQYTVSEMIQICEPMLPYWNQIRYNKPSDPWPEEVFILID